jgi:hypothetical protein
MHDATVEAGKQEASRRGIEDLTGETLCFGIEQGALLLLRWGRMCIRIRPSDRSLIVWDVSAYRLPDASCNAQGLNRRELKEGVLN